MSKVRRSSKYRHCRRNDSEKQTRSPRYIDEITTRNG